MRNINWNDSEVNQLTKSIIEMIAGKPDYDNKLSGLLIKAQRSLPEDRRKSEAAVYKYVEKNRHAIKELISKLQAEVSPISSGVIANGVEVLPKPSVISSEVSSVAAVSGSTVEVSGEASVPSKEVAQTSRYIGRNAWTPKETKRVYRKMAELLIEDPSLEGKYSSLLKRAQIDILPKDMHKTSKAIYMHVFNKKVEVTEAVLHYKYLIEKKDPALEAEDKAVEVAPLEEIQSAQESEAVSSEPTPQVHVSDFLEINLDSLRDGMNRLTDMFIMGIQNQMVSKIDTFISTLPQIIEPRLEAAMTKSMKEVMSKLEPKVASVIKAREVIRKKVLVVGPQADQQNAIVREMGEVFDFKFVASDENSKMVNNVVNNMDHVVGMVNKMNHKHSNSFRNHPSVHLVTGGTSAIIAKLQELYINS